jgi:serine/threonine-protein kinase
VETAANREVPQTLQDALAARYAIEREIGRGGMATVYRARDLRHQRLVALKVLHPELAAVLGAERFLKEIELTASLQHPHILPLFDSGDAGGLLYYVMPYVEGETLRSRLTREVQLPVDEALRITREAAAALDYAHRHGVVHRDVKPENILLQDGHVQVADFGIALAVQHAGGPRLTQTGLSLGTPQYMAPEQAVGDKSVDARADIYALGAVAYEMMAGEPPFVGPTAQAVIAKALTEVPKPLTAVRQTVPVEIDAAIRRALEKLPADRFTSAAAFVAALDAGGAPVARTAALPAGSAGRARTRGLAAIIAAVGVVGIALGWVVARLSDSTPTVSRPVRFTIELDSGVLRFGEPAISPDGATIVYAAEGPDGTTLYARRMDETTPQPLAGTDNADEPFFSPDGEWVAFYSNDALRKVRVTGGEPVVIASLPHATAFAGGTWVSGDVIYYAESPAGTISRVAASGGRPERIRVADSTLRLLAPHPLPGGRAMVVSIFEMGINVMRIAVLDLESGQVRVSGSGIGARYANGSLIYLEFRGLYGELFRRPFDVRRLVFTGDAEPLVSGIAPVVALARFGFDVAGDGSFVALAGRRRFGAERRSLAVLDRTGRVVRTIPARAPWEPRFSPDGKRVAYGAYPPGRDSADVYIADLASGTTQRLTSDTRDNNDPIWSPDGRTIAYDKLGPGGKDLYVQPVEGGEARLVAGRPGSQFPTEWLPDGILLLELNGMGGIDVFVQPHDGRPARPYAATTARETAARASPDGRWVAYQSDESGRDEIYVDSYPTPGRRTLVSAGGGANPVWGRDGRDLYYWKVDQLIAARVEPGSPGRPLEVRSRTTLFTAPYVENIIAAYDVSPNGREFVMVTGESRPGRLVVAVGAAGTRAARRPDR